MWEFILNSAVRIVVFFREMKFAFDWLSICFAPVFAAVRQLQLSFFLVGYGGSF